jgi:hypothetical protein
VAALAEGEVPTLRRALLGEPGQANRGVSLLERAVELADDDEQLDL